MKRVVTLAIAPATLAIVAAASAGGPVAAMAGSGHRAAPVAHVAAGGALHVRHTSVGTILTDRRGRTVYLFEKDKTKASTCYGACASAWPPVAARTKPRA